MSIKQDLKNILITFSGITIVLWITTLSYDKRVIFDEFAQYKKENSQYVAELRLSVQNLEEKYDTTLNTLTQTVVEKNYLQKELTAIQLSQLANTTKTSQVPKNIPVTVAPAPVIPVVVAPKITTPTTAAQTTQNPPKPSRKSRAS